MNRIAFKLPEAESRDLGKPLRVLLVEHSGSDAELCLQELKRAGVEVHCDIVQSREEFSERVRSSTYDIVLADYRASEPTSSSQLPVRTHDGTRQGVRCAALAERPGGPGRVPGTAKPSDEVATAPGLESSRTHCSGPGEPSAQGGPGKPVRS